MRGRLVASVLVAGSLTATACGFFFPFSPDNLGETRARALCHVAFACCTPIERSEFIPFFGLDYNDEGACVSELLEDASLGFVFTIDQIAKDTLARGAGEYDGEAAERCSRAQYDAVQQCDVDKLVNAAGEFDFARGFGLIDPNDAECSALAGRGFVRGNVGDGDDCESSIDCADFGNCVVEEEEGETVLTVKGKCVTPGEEGDACAEIGCQPGLACQVPATGGEPVCQEPVLLDDGETCDFDDECASGNCADVGGGTCFNAGTPCVDDGDCDEAAGDFCVDGFESECQPAPDVTVEICDGQ